jgi:hypothetical protein
MVRHRRSGTARTLSVFPLLQAASDKTDASRSWSLLYGLAGYKREGLHKSFRLLYFLNVGRRTAAREHDIYGDGMKDAGKL